VILFVIKELTTKCSTFVFTKLKVVASVSLWARVCVVLAGISEGLVGPRAIERTCRCCGTE